MQPTLVHRSCPLCQGAQATPLFEKGALRVVRCRLCSMVYADPVEEELATGVFYDTRESAYYLSPEKLQSDYAPVRFARELKHFRRFCREGAVLDVGCSTGGFLYQLSRHFPGAYEVTGTDVTQAALDHAERQGIQVRRNSFLEFETNFSTYDAITFWAVLEHLMEPRRFLEKAGQLLRPGGHCFVLVPNMRSLAVRWLGSKYRYMMPDHVNYFARNSLLALGEQIPGFQPARVTTTHFNPLVIWQDWRRPQERVPDEERARLLHKTTAWKQTPWLKPAKSLYSLLEWFLSRTFLADNLLVVWRKST